MEMLRANSTIIISAHILHIHNYYYLKLTALTLLIFSFIMVIHIIINDYIMAPQEDPDDIHISFKNI